MAARPASTRSHCASSPTRPRSWPRSAAAKSTRRCSASARRRTSGWRWPRVPISPRQNCSSRATQCSTSTTSATRSTIRACAARSRLPSTHERCSRRRLTCAGCRATDRSCPAPGRTRRARGPARKRRRRSSRPRRGCRASTGCSRATVSRCGWNWRSTPASSVRRWRARWRAGWPITASMSRWWCCLRQSCSRGGSSRATTTWCCSAGRPRSTRTPTAHGTRPRSCLRAATSAATTTPRPTRCWRRHARRWTRPNGAHSTGALRSASWRPCRA